MLTALASELALRRDYLGTRPSLDTVYFGGGTPSLLSADELRRLFDVIGQHFDLAPGAEITLEANPDDLTAAWLAGLRTTPINRLSLGIQSFHEPHLRLMNRAHSAVEALHCARAAQDAGFANLSIDLIYGIPTNPPGQHGIWEQDLETALSLHTPHISAYALTIEPDTALGRWTAKGRFRPAPDEFTARQFEMLVAALTAGGYEHYEISNFARPGHEARHNSAYWAGSAYLGIGPSAHSFDGNRTRQANVASNAKYLAALAQGTVPASVEHLTLTDRANEYLMTTLRTSRGVELPRLLTEFGRDLPAQHAPYLADLVARGLAVLTPNTLQLTSAGRLLADEITLALFV